MASNSTTPNEGVSGDEDNNSQNTIKKAATWKLLSEYNNKFDKDEDYIEFTKTIQQATGASDAVITSAILYRTSPYSNKPKATTTTQVTNTPRGPFQIAAAAAAAKRNNTTAESSLTRTATTNNNNNNNNAVTSGENASRKRRRHVPGLQSSTDNRGGDQRSIRVQPRAANQGTLNFTIGNAGDDNGDDVSIDEEHTEDNAQRRKAIEDNAQARAIDKIQQYAESFPNGSIDDVPDEEESDCCELNDNTNSTEKGKGKRRSYIPKAGSAVKEYLDQIKEKVAPSINNNNPPLDLTKISPWIPPPNNPLSTGLGQSAEPSKFYQSKIWAYIFEPMSQYKRLMPAKYECCHCKSHNTK